MAEQVILEAVDLVRRFEGFSPTPYLCPVGVWTIGYGSTYGLDGKRVTRTSPDIDEEAANRLLQRDLDRAAASVGRLIYLPLSGPEMGALASFVYNLGAGALQASTLRRKINDGEWDDVPGQFMRWVHGGGRILPGLVRRRAAEVELWLS